MQWIRNPQIERELYERLRKKYHTEKPLPHLTEVIGCLTRSYFDRFEPLQLTDRELALFSIGFGLETVILRDEDTPAPESVQLDGLWLTPDYTTVSEGELDLKSTRMYPGEDGSPKRGLPEGWKIQFMAYAYRWMLQQEQAMPVERYEIPYSVGIVYLGAAEIACGTFMFKRDELVENWAYVQSRKDIYMQYVEKQRCPAPYAFNQDWECNYCRYSLRCQTRSKE